MSDGLDVQDSIYNLGDAGIEQFRTVVTGKLTVTTVTKELTFRWSMSLPEFWAWLKQRIGRVRR